MNETGDKATRDKEYPKLAGNHHYFGRTKVCRGRNCSGLCWNRVVVPESLSYIDARFYLRRQHYTCLSCKIKCQIAGSCLRAKLNDFRKHQGLIFILEAVNLRHTRLHLKNLFRVPNILERCSEVNRRRIHPPHC